jgi:tetratricopeptide (TPR) repeat protein
MKKIGILIACVSIQLLFSVDIKVMLDSAKDAYRHKKYEQAIQFYQNILQEGYVSSELYFNLGNAYYRAKDYPRALWSYEKVLCWDPSFKDARYNMDLINRKIYLNKTIRPPYVSTMLFWKIYGWMSWRNWVIATIVLFALSVVFYILFLISNSLKKRRWFFYSALIALGVWIFSFLITWLGYRQIYENRYAYVVDSDIVIRSEPMDGSPALGTVKPGVKIRLIKTENQYYYLETPDGIKGWTRKGNILPLKVIAPEVQ